MRRFLPALAWKRPTAVLMLFVAMIVLGGIAWDRISVQLLPSGFDSPSLFISVPYPNATPIETDDLILRPILGQLNTVRGISEIRSTARADSASFQVTFYSSTEMGEAYNEVVDRLERAMPSLPEEVSRYFIFKFNPEDQPISFVGVSLPPEVEDPYHLLNRVVQPAVDRVPGVASVDSFGVPMRGIFVDYDRESLISHSVGLGAVQSRLLRDNFQMSGGEIEARGKNSHVRSLYLFEGPGALRSYPVRDQIVLDDIAEVSVRSGYSASINRLNGDGAAILMVRKDASANTVEVCEAITVAFDELREDPRLAGVGFYPFFDQGEVVSESLNNLLEAMLIGGAFAVVILFLFLREWRMTLLITASIPFSLLITISVLYFRGDSLNLLVLMGLMLAVGMVVDNAIVVVETIYRRRAEGASPREAAISGTAEVNLAIIMSTLTTMVVFLPIILMSESATFSFFMGALGMPVVFALAGSLVVALIFAPLATRFIGGARVKPDAWWLRGLTKLYLGLLGWVLARRVDATLFLVAVVGLTAAVPMWNLTYAQEGFGGGNQFTVFVEVAPQYGAAERSRSVRRVEDALAEHQEEWGIDVYYADFDASRDEGRVNVFMDSDGPMERADVMAALEDELVSDEAGVSYRVDRPAARNQSDKTRLSLRVTGEDMETLIGLGEEVVRRVKTLPEVEAVRRETVNSGSNEKRLRVNRLSAERFGLTAGDIGGTVGYYMRSNTLPPLREGEREIDVVSRFEADDRDDLATILDFPIFSQLLGKLIPLRALVDVEDAKGPRAVRRIGNQTSIEVSVDLAEGVSVYRGYGTIRPALTDMNFPRGYGWDMGNEFDFQMEDDAARNLALLLSVTFVFLIMGVLFESLILPLAILSTIPMALVGVYWILWLTGTPLDLMAGVGLVVLVGVVVNNGIVMVDLIHQLRARGAARREAVLEAGRRRFRPILMTALTTIFGLIPMALGSSNLVGIPYAPLGRTVIGGLIAATLLTLLFIPFLYEALDDVRTVFGRWRLFVWGVK